MVERVGARLASVEARRRNPLGLAPAGPPAAGFEHPMVGAAGKGQADLAILPSNLVDSLNWPVVAILRQNVMALIVPASAAIPAPSDTVAKMYSALE